MMRQILKLKLKSKMTLCFEIFTLAGLRVPAHVLISNQAPNILYPLLIHKNGCTRETE